MTKREDVLNAANSAAKRKLRPIEVTAAERREQWRKAGRAESDGMFGDLAEVHVDGFREVCDTAADIIAELEGENTCSFADDLRNLLIPLQKAVDDMFGQYRSPSHRTSRQEFDRHVDKFHADLDAVLDEVVSNLRLNLVRGVNVRNKAKQNHIRVDAPGSLVQVMTDSPGATQRIGDSLGMSANDVRKLAEALNTLRQEVGASQASQESIQLAEDAIVNAEQELASSPNPSRLRRLLEAIRDRAIEVGVNASGSALGYIMVVASGLPT